MDCDESRDVGQIELTHGSTARWYAKIKPEPCHEPKDRMARLQIESTLAVLRYDRHYPQRTCEHQTSTYMSFAMESIAFTLATTQRPRDWASHLPILRYGYDTYTPILCLRFLIT